MSRILGLTFSIMLLCANAQAQTTRVVVDESRVEQWAQKNRSALQIPSLAVGIVDARGPRALQVLGAEPDQPFLIGSLSKSVTALAVMLLVHDQKLTLDAPVNQWYPGVPEGIDVRSLLHQTSGLDRADGGDAWTSDASLEEMIAGATWDQPGAFSYSNLNYQILGGIIEAVSGKTYADFVGARIFEPLQMQNSTAGPKPSGHVVGHQYFYGFPVALGERAYNPVATPSGFVWMSANDMVTYLHAFVTRGEVDGEEILPREVFDAVLEKPESTPYAMGWLIRTEPEYANHAGATSSFTSAMAVVPDRWAVFTLANLNTYGASGTATVNDGLLAMLDVVEPEAASNLEFVVRLALGLFTLLIIALVFWQLFTWMRLGFPWRIMPTKRLGVAFVFVADLAVVLYIVYGTGAALGSIAATQPDLFISFAVFTVGTLAWQMLRGLNTSAAFYASDEP